MNSNYFLLNNATTNKIPKQNKTEHMQVGNSSSRVLRAQPLGRLVGFDLGMEANASLNPPERHVVGNYNKYRLMESHICFVDLA